MSTYPSKTRTPSIGLDEDCRQAVQALRSQLIDLYASLELDPDQPQEVARRLKLNKNLTWKISKIINAADGLSAIPHVPGAAGMEILLTCLESAGAPKRYIDGVRDALDQYDETVQRHAGDRANLDLMLDSMGLVPTGVPLLTSRELAFQGNSGIWGLQARARVAAAFVVPSPTDPNLVDTALVAGLIGLRRLRVTSGWPLFRFMEYKTGTGEFTPSAPEEIDTSRHPGDPPGLLRRFCSASMPEIETRQDGNAFACVLPPGPIGNTGAFDCFFGDIRRGKSRYRDNADDYAEFAASVKLPTETLIFDLIAHRSLDIPTPEVRVFGRPMGGPDDPEQRAPESLLPLAERCVELAGHPPAVATPLVPRYTELVHLVMERLGYSPREFRGWRLLIPWPPMTSTAVLRWPLEARPNT